MSRVFQSAPFCGVSWGGKGNSLREVCLLFSSNSIVLILLVAAVVSSTSFVRVPLRIIVVASIFFCQWYERVNLCRGPLG